MSLLKKMLNFNINNENLTQKEQRDIDEITILQDYIDKYDLNFMTAYICRDLIFNGFSAKEAINILNENREYTPEEISVFKQLKKEYSTENGLDYAKYKEAAISYFYKLENAIFTKNKGNLE